MIFDDGWKITGDGAGMENSDDLLDWMTIGEAVDAVLDECGLKRESPSGMEVRRRSGSCLGREVVAGDQGADRPLLGVGRRSADDGHAEGVSTGCVVLVFPGQRGHASTRASDAAMASAHRRRWSSRGCSAQTIVHP